MPAHITPLGCYEATKDPGEEDEETDRFFAGGNVWFAFFFSSISPAMWELLIFIAKPRENRVARSIVRKSGQGKRCEDGKGKSDALVVQTGSHTQYQDPPLPGCSPWLWLWSIPSQCMCCRVIAVDRQNQGVCLIFSNILKKITKNNKQGLVHKSRRVGVWCFLGQISHLTRQTFSDPGDTGTTEEGL